MAKRPEPNRKTTVHPLYGLPENTGNVNTTLERQPSDPIPMESIKNLLVTVRNTPEEDTQLQPRNFERSISHNDNSFWVRVGGSIKGNNFTLRVNRNQQNTQTSSQSGRVREVDSTPYKRESDGNFFREISDAGPMFEIEIESSMEATHTGNSNGLNVQLTFSTEVDQNVNYLILQQEAGSTQWQDITETHTTIQGSRKIEIPVKKSSKIWVIRLKKSFSSLKQALLALINGKILFHILVYYITTTGKVKVRIIGISEELYQNLKHLRTSMTIAEEENFQKCLEVPPKYLVKKGYLNVEVTKNGERVKSEKFDLRGSNVKLQCWFDHSFSPNELKENLWVRATDMDGNVQWSLDLSEALCDDNKSAKQPGSEDISKPKITSFDDEVCENHIPWLAQQLNKDVEKVARYLGVDLNKIDAMKEGECAETRSIKILDFWRKKTLDGGNKPRWNQIKSALESECVERFDVIRRLQNTEEVDDEIFLWPNPKVENLIEALEHDTMKKNELAKEMRKKLGISRSSSDDEGTVEFKGKSEWKPSRSEQIKKMFTVDGGAIETNDITLMAGEGCLAENTDIIMERADHQFDVSKSLLDLGLVDAAPRVVKFSPGGLEFSKPVDLTIKFEKTATDSERFILHGFYNPIYQRIVWELVTNGVEENDAEGVIRAKIISFSFYMFILSTRGKLARIISHLNHSFSCLAYSLFRRSPSAMDTVDIAVVLVSEFFDEKKENNINHLLAEGFVKGEKGVLKRVNTDHPLEMCLHFPGIESPPYRFQVDQPQLDSVGFVIDYFKEIGVRSPANGKVKISKTHGRRDESESLWILNVVEKNEESQAEVVQVLEQSPSPEVRPEGQSASLEPSPVVVNWTTKLTNDEITQMSHKIGIDWDNLAALMDIPYSEREEIRVNYGKYPSFLSRAEQVLKRFNESECFDRTTLIKYLEELKLHDVKNKMVPMNDQSESEEGGNRKTATSQPEISEMQLQNDTPLSSREMCRLSRQLVVTWGRLAALLGITRAERDDIRYSLLYINSHSKAEKMLAIFNNMEDFSRQKLVDCFEEIGQSELKEPILTGEWRR